jgi:hypothetical protein
MRKALKNNIVTYFFPLVAIALLLPSVVFATDTKIMDKLKTTAETIGYKTSGEGADLAGVVGLVINMFFSLLGVIFIALIVAAGYHWMIAQGAQDKIKDAKDSLRSAIIGLVITVGAYAIWDFVWTYLT